MRTPPSSWNSTAGTSGGGTTQTVVITETTGDDIIVVTFTTSTTATVSSVSDGTNTYARLFTHAATSVGTGEIWAALGSTVSGSQTVTVTWGATATFNSVWAADIPGLVTTAILDTSTFSGTTSASINAPSSIVSTPAELAVYGFMGTSPLLTTVTPNLLFVYSSVALHAINFGVMLLEQGTTSTINPVWQQTASGLYQVPTVLLKQQQPTTFTESPSEVPDETNTVNYATQVLTSVVLPPMGSSSAATVGQTFPPPVLV